MHYKTGEDSPSPMIGPLSNLILTGSQPRTNLSSMKTIHLAVLALGLVGVGWLLAGCVPAGVQPFYGGADVVYEPALLGLWKDKPGGKEGWNFTAGEGKSYSLEIQSDDQRAGFEAHLFKLGAERFLDLYPAKPALESSLEKNPYGVALIPGHLFVRVRATSPALRMSCMSLDWLREQLKQAPKALDHVVTGDRVVFTGSTDSMQTFIKQHLDDAAAWNEMYGTGLVRVANSGQK